ncbi:cytidine/deoxycytidylate deaminase family protein [bacterium]|nr:cytidine/deoxycytidylate deaminase family protein [bacterium]
MKRPSWDQYFLKIARLVATRATCLRRAVGAVLVRDRHLLATGYNGAPTGLKHCEELGGCLREQLGIPSGTRHEICRGTHAEQNAIAQAARFGLSTDGATIYVTNHPCSICTKILINAGIQRIVYAEGYPDELAVKLLAEATKNGLMVEQIELDED